MPEVLSSTHASIFHLLCKEPYPLHVVTGPHGFQVLGGLTFPSPSDAADCDYPVAIIGAKMHLNLLLPFCKHQGYGLEQGRQGTDWKVTLMHPELRKPHLQAVLEGSLTFANFPPCTICLFSCRLCCLNCLVPYCGEFLATYFPFYFLFLGFWKQTI